MNTEAIDLLKNQLKRAREEAKQLLNDHKLTIEAGQRAQREVDNANHTVAQLTEAIAVLEADYKRRFGAEATQELKLDAPTEPADGQGR